MRSNFIDTGLIADDDDPQISEDGYGVMSPSFDEEDMLEALEEPDYSESQAELPPQEAYETMKFMAPLDEGELELLRESPFLTPGPEHPNSGNLTFVDDSDHDEWLFARQGEKGKAMDDTLEDQMYGDEFGNDNTEYNGRSEEEIMDLLGSEKIYSGYDVGFGLKSITRAVRGAARGVSRGVRSGVRATGRGAVAVERGAVKSVKKVGGLIKKVLTAPARALIRKFKGRMVNQRAADLAKKAGRKAPNINDTAQAKVWSNRWLATKGGKFGRALSSMSGDDWMAGDDVGSAGELLSLAILPFGALNKLLTSLFSSAKKDSAADTGEPVDDQAYPEDAQAAAAEQDAAYAEQEAASSSSPDDGGDYGDVPDESMGSISKDVYGAAVARHATRLAGRGPVTTKHMRASKAAVDGFLKSARREKGI